MMAMRWHLPMVLEIDQQRVTRMVWEKVLVLMSLTAIRSVLTLPVTLSLHWQSK